jgi:hypothetical protein
MQDNFNKANALGQQVYRVSGIDRAKLCSSKLVQGSLEHQDLGFGI